MNGLGVIHNEGTASPRNVRIARQRFENAASLDDHEARRNLAEPRR
jgi:TPR repeat protein